MDYRINIDSFFLITLFLFLLVGMIIPLIIFRHTKGQQQLKRIRRRSRRLSQNLAELDRKHARNQIVAVQQENEQLGLQLEKELNQLIRLNPSESDLIAFYSNFEKLYPHFIQTLQRVTPDLTLNEVRLCILIRLNLSSKEMARLLHISPDSVNKARYRLRKKMHLPAGEDIYHYLISV